MITRLSSISQEKLLSVFVDYLDIVYLAKTHFVERFSEVSDSANFNDLKAAIDENVYDIRNQIMRIEAIYIIIERDPDMGACDAFVNMAEEAFYKIQKNSIDTQIRDLNILFYMQSIENMEIAAFQVLQLIATRLKLKAVRAMLRESFDEAKEDRVLLLSIMGKMINV
ncbi:DUF892 family protein [Mucilaginibacter achroorhodeus]|uniref:DUF892 family protein n=1 Tax=Mucilaginibacter achroorhodeus TaxID=2599294 RepID=A0A563U6P0_9SPHI|nr:MULTISPECIES: DUF892 family protein [Mucilaginibacter]QXV64855.1 DUF892 family protein [Mucilaginibacter sp. 21P]TWR27005.1 DUF892 family protein [Mucilaginibacter achroorhodeus]